MPGPSRRRNCLSAFASETRSSGAIAQRPGFSQVWLEDGLPLVVSVDAGTFAKRELQVFDTGRDRVGGTERASGHVIGHQHDPGAADARDFGSDLAEPLWLHRGGNAADDPVDDSFSPLARHRLWSELLATFIGRVPSSASDCRRWVVSNEISSRTPPPPGISRNPDALQRSGISR